MQKSITGYHLDDEGQWVAELECGHNRHVRHDPPLVDRARVITESGRDSMLGNKLKCSKCEQNLPVDNK